MTVEVRGLLFDMDGVLIDSTGADERAWIGWATYHGMERDFPLRATHGRRAIDSLRDLRPDLDAAVELERLETFDSAVGEAVPLLAGVERLIARLPEGAWTVVTSAPERLMRRRLGSAGLQLPPAVVTADKVTHGKPHPEPYLAGARVLGLAPAECLVIEDAPAGVKAGKAAGCKVLGVVGSHRAEELIEADWRVASLEDVTAEAVEGGWIRVCFSALAG
jgi:sugar-phosphatase